MYSILLIERIAATLHHSDNRFSALGIFNNTKVAVLESVVFAAKSCGLEMTDWEGHEIATSAALLDVITTATTGSARPSHADRILFTACEFWASARNCTLLEQLREDPVPQLQAAEAAFRLIGLAGTAEIIANGRRILTEGPPTLLQQVAQEIENSLAHIDEPVDQMIAKYAKQQARARQN